MRQPIYTGGFLAAIDSAITAGGGWVFPLIILGDRFLWRIGAEDRLMERQFPNKSPTIRGGRKR